MISKYSKRSILLDWLQNNNKTLRKIEMWKTLYTNVIPLSRGDVRGLKLPKYRRFYRELPFHRRRFHEITILGLRDLVYSPNTEENVLKLPYYRP